MIYYQTTLNEMPLNCKECYCHWCRLPLKRVSHDNIKDEVKKCYETKRHKDCPLKEDAK